MNVALLVTLAGPILGFSGWFLHINWLFWGGVAICALTLFLNLASGVMKLPVLPVLFMAIAAVFTSPWYLGLGAGLVAWTALEAVGEVIGLRREGQK
jgi:hypothetical protein